MKTSRKFLVPIAIILFFVLVAAVPQVGEAPSFVEGIEELWATIIALPGQVWLNALYLFVTLGLLKAVRVVKEDGQAQLANLVMAIVLGGGFDSLADLNAMLQTSAISVIAGVYYLIWRDFLKGLLIKAWDYIQLKFVKK